MLTFYFPQDYGHKRNFREKKIYFKSREHSNPKYWYGKNFIYSTITCQIFVAEKEEEDLSRNLGVSYLKNKHRALNNIF